MLHKETTNCAVTWLSGNFPVNVKISTRTVAEEVEKSIWATKVSVFILFACDILHQRIPRKLLLSFTLNCMGSKLNGCHWTGQQRKVELGKLELREVASLSSSSLSSSRIQHYHLSTSFSREMMNCGNFPFGQSRPSHPPHIQCTFLHLCLPIPVISPLLTWCPFFASMVMISILSCYAIPPAIWNEFPWRTADPCRMDPLISESPLRSSRIPMNGLPRSLLSTNLINFYYTTGQ